MLILRSPDALRGLDKFEYIWLIWDFSLNREREGWHPTVRPPRLGGNASLGVFATRSPYRPNPFGLSSVRLVSVDFEKCVLKVSGADLVDGTPIYDIKPYIPYSDCVTDAAGGFADASAVFKLHENPERALSLCRAFLDNNDSYPALQKMGMLFKTGPTLTNVMDMALVIVE